MPLMQCRCVLAYIAAPPKPWMKATALLAYLRGCNEFKHHHFTDDPWDVQVLPHTHMKPGQRQVKDEDGFFTEVATRLKAGWRFLVGANLEGFPETRVVVRLGGEGHHALVSKVADSEEIQGLQALTQPNKPDAIQPGMFAYLLTPGLAETSEELVYGLYPHAWKECLLGCVGDRALWWGGVRSRREERKQKQSEELKTVKTFALQPQRAFVQPGTVYCFKTGCFPRDRLLPDPKGKPWLDTFHKLNYGTLLWGQR
ncbi:type III-B CRISPR module-associated Cmr3 family protein [Spirulina sp. 06S082]|uniref:type III-B CRISPR module-associated Cmr3 family protein n=1 Tax=Spirulina sp. 06S082 TaxID=3110248 RepID=UPI002B1FBA36|nr:type III-B CRISPR module-associated Cmr3 family protein [Spirulina sp. 06S082]MEA5470082.1 type III-B CRISPR module-associated Cmr3 family protein [Spirulina sp. 06S082]